MLAHMEWLLIVQVYIDIVSVIVEQADSGLISDFFSTLQTAVFDPGELGSATFVLESGLTRH